MVESLDLNPEDTVLEIGPGHGVLTGRMAGQVRRLVVVEFDRFLARKLVRKFGTLVEVVEEDFLRFDFAALGSIKVIGNLPYNISSQVLFRLLDSGGNWTVAVLTTQREFGARVLAHPGSRDYAALSVFTDLVCTRERLFNVPADCFRPRPKVVSTAIRLKRRESPAFEPDEPELFRRVVKACFCQKRKMLVNNLTCGLALAKSEALSLIEAAGIAATGRAEQLSTKDFGRLYCFVRERLRSSS